MPKNVFLKKETSSMRRGFTLVELLLVIGTLAVLMLLVVLVTNPTVQMAKARDSRRKADIRGLEQALEDYATDHYCYPEEVLVNSCSPGDGLQPYLKKIPCDPLSKEPYTYVLLDGCKKYVIYSKLENATGKTYASGYNYAVSSPNYNVDTGETSPVSTPIPTAAATGPTPNPYTLYYGCFSGICKAMSGPNCQPNYLGYPSCDPSGRNLCGSPGSPRNECR